MNIRFSNISKSSILLACVSTIAIQACKTRSPSSAAKDANIHQIGSNDVVVVYQKDNKVYAVTCPIPKSEDVAADNTDIAFVTRDTCNESTNLYQSLSTAEYKDRLNQIVGYEKATYDAAVKYLKTDGKNIAPAEAQLTAAREELANLLAGKSSGGGGEESESSSGKTVIDYEAVAAQKNAIRAMEQEFSTVKAKYMESKDLVERFERRRDTASKIFAKLAPQEKAANDEAKSKQDADHTFMIKSTSGGYILGPFTDDSMNRWKGPLKLNPAERDAYVKGLSSRKWFVAGGGYSNSRSSFQQSAQLCADKGGRLPKKNELELLAAFGPENGESEVIKSIGDQAVYTIPVYLELSEAVYPDFRIFAGGPSTRGGYNQRTFPMEEKEKFKGTKLKMIGADAFRVREGITERIGGDLTISALCISGAEATTGVYATSTQQFFSCTAEFPPGRMADLLDPSDRSSQTIGDDRVVKCASAASTKESALEHLNYCIKTVRYRLRTGGYTDLSPIGSEATWCRDYLESTK